MKRKYSSLLGFLTLMLFVSCQPSSTKPLSLSEEISQTDLQNLEKTLRTPRGAVLAFFAAVEKSDTAALRKIMSPRLQEHLDKVSAEDRRANPRILRPGWEQDWVGRWKKEINMIQAVGEALPPNFSRDGVETTRVTITATKNGEIRQVSVKVAKYGEFWRWDEI